MQDYKFQENKELQLNYKKNENKCLLITIILNFTLLIIEFVFYFLTKSSSILFDASYSLIMTTTVVFAYALNNILEKKNLNYPLGQSIYENIFTLLKSVLIIAMMTLFAYGSISTLVKISSGKMIIEQLPSYEIYLAYVITSCFFSTVIFLVFFFYNKKMEKKSIIINIEMKSCVLDFGISFSVGLALLVTSITSGDDIMIREIIDKSVTLLFIVIVSPEVFKTLFSQVLIIAGHRVFKVEENELKNHLKEKCIIDIYIRRFNSEKIFMIKVDSDLIEVPIKVIQAKISEHIFKHYSSDTKIVYIL
ncbi:MAG: cation transporter [Mycoplasma sp.]